MKTFACVSLSLLLALAASAQGAERPNIILIMVDDMGFSDLGFQGGEINTPNIDALAADGVRFSQFYNNGRCCPTRATLMTGLYPHQTGIGHMTESPGELNYGEGKSPAYQGYLNDNCVTIAEALQGAGYATLMSGKWHLGQNDESRWPLQRGFDKYFGCLSGATLHFYPGGNRGMSLGNEKIEQPESTTDQQFYTTDAFTDYAIRFLKEEQAGEKRPTFLYLAYTAPHWPIQAFEEDIAKYRGKYKIGWDKLRERRLAKQKELGLVSADLELSPRTPKIPAWDELDADKQDEMDLKMAIYAAMIDRIDQNIGKLTAYLKESGQDENTLIFFLSDNGGCQEGGVLGGANFRDVEKRNHEYFHGYGEAWANASNTPFRLYKHFNHEGGTATPFFMRWPAKIAAQKDWYGEPAQLIDVMPTILDVAGATYPTNFEGNAIHPLDGISLRPAMSGQSLARQKPICIEHENNASIRSGDWKLVGRNVARPRGVHPENWELYDIAQDRTETNNLAAENPAKVRELSQQWDAWAKRAGVYPKLKDEPAKKPTPKGS